MTFDDIFDGQSVMAILRGLAAAETVRLAERLWDAGVTVLEVPIGAPTAERMPRSRPSAPAGPDACS